MFEVSNLLKFSIDEKFGVIILKFMNHILFTNQITQKSLDTVFQEKLQHTVASKVVLIECITVQHNPMDSTLTL